MGENATSREQPLGLGEKENAALLFCRSRFQTRSPGLSPEVSRRRILRFPRERGCPGPHGTPRPPTALPRSFKGDGNSPQPRGDSSSPCPSFSSFGEHRAVSGRGISLSVRAERGGLRNKAISLARGGRCRMGAGDVSLWRVEGGVRGLIKCFLQIYTSKRTSSTSTRCLPAGIGLQDIPHRPV